MFKITKLSEPFLLAKIYEILPLRIGGQGLCMPDNPNRVFSSSNCHIQSLPFSQETDALWTGKGGLVRALRTGCLVPLLPKASYAVVADHSAQ